MKTEQEIFDAAHELGFTAAAECDGSLAALCGYMEGSIGSVFHQSEGRYPEIAETQLATVRATATHARGYAAGFNRWRNERNG